MAPPLMFTMIWFAGVIELVGGALLTLGLFTRAAAFIMSGEMAIGYFLARRRADSFLYSTAATRQSCTASSFSIWFSPTRGRGASMRCGSRSGALRRRLLARIAALAYRKVVQIFYARRRAGGR
jgi:DoxX-like protein